MGASQFAGGGFVPRCVRSGPKRSTAPSHGMQQALMSSPLRAAPWEALIMRLVVERCAHSSVVLSCALYLGALDHN